MHILFVALISVMMSVAAQFLLKAGVAGLKGTASSGPFAKTLTAFIMNPHIIGGFMLYGLGAMVWLAVLSKWDVSKAYPLVGVGFILSVGIGYMMGEDVTLFRCVGVLMIAVGVLVVARS